MEQSSPHKPRIWPWNLILAAVAVIVVCILFSPQIGWWLRTGGVELPGLDSPDQLILYSIDGDDRPRKQTPPNVETFHTFPVLGKIDIVDPASRAEISKAIMKGVKESDGSMAKCFWPRHGIRATRSGKSTDYVICFECDQFEVHSGNQRQVHPITREPQNVLNRHLTAAGVPLAPGMKDN